MAELSTFILLDRNMLTWRWYKEPVTSRVFIHLLILANATAKPVEDIIVQRGQVVTSYKSLSESLGISVKQCRTALNRLKRTNEVAIKTTNKFSLITIVNYEKYQSIDSYRANKRTSKTASEGQAKGKQWATTKSVKSVKSDKENISSSRNATMEEIRNL